MTEQTVYYGKDEGRLSMASHVYEQFVVDQASDPAKAKTQLIARIQSALGQAFAQGVNTVMEVNKEQSVIITDLTSQNCELKNAPPNCAMKYVPLLFFLILSSSALADELKCNLSKDAKDMAYRISMDCLHEMDRTVKLGTTGEWHSVDRAVLPTAPSL